MVSDRKQAQQQEIQRKAGTALNDLIEHVVRTLSQQAQGAAVASFVLANKEPLDSPKRHSMIGAAVACRGLAKYYSELADRIHNDQAPELLESFYRQAHGEPPKQ